MEMIFVVGFFAIISGCIGAAIADRKLNAVAGFWWGFLLGPIGWIIAALMPKNETAINQAAIAEKREKVCPACLSNIPFAASKCRHCASDQPEAPIIDNVTHSRAEAISAESIGVFDRVIMPIIVLAILAILVVSYMLGGR